jgi:hypothetical protein
VEVDQDGQVRYRAEAWGGGIAAATTSGPRAWGGGGATARGSSGERGGATTQGRALLHSHE